MFKDWLFNYLHKTRIKVTTITSKDGITDIKIYTPQHRYMCLGLIPVWTTIPHNRFIAKGFEGDMLELSKLHIDTFLSYWKHEYGKTESTSYIKYP